MSAHKSADSKPLTANSKSFRCNTYEKQGGGGTVTVKESVAHPEVYPACPEHLGGTVGRGTGELGWISISDG